MFKYKQINIFLVHCKLFSLRFFSLFSRWIFQNITIHFAINRICTFKICGGKFCIRTAIFERNCNASNAAIWIFFPFFPSSFSNPFALFYHFSLYSFSLFFARTFRELWSNENRPTLVKSSLKFNERLSSRMEIANSSIPRRQV